jgi:hypothetical protein
MRMTLKQLQNKVEYINELSGTPKQPYNNRVSQINCYYIGQAYGGYRLEQISNKSGGAKDISDRLTARELSYFLNGMITGLEQAKGMR